MGRVLGFAIVYILLDIISGLVRPSESIISVPPALDAIQRRLFRRQASHLGQRRS